MLPLTQHTVLSKLNSLSFNKKEMSCFKALTFFSLVVKGEWQDGRKAGRGVERTSEGSYEGEWKDNMVLNIPAVIIIKVVNLC